MVCFVLAWFVGYPLVSVKEFAALNITRVIRKKRSATCLALSECAAPFDDFKEDSRRYANLLMVFRNYQNHRSYQTLLVFLRVYSSIYDRDCFNKNVLHCTTWSKQPDQALTLANLLVFSQNFASARS